MLNTGITTPLTKRTAVSRRAENPPVWPCEPLCRASGGGQASVPHRSKFVALVGPVCGSPQLLPEHASTPKSRVNLPVENIAGERTGAFVAPVRSQLPAVRAVPEDGSRRFFGGDVICLTLIFGKEPEKPAVAGFIVTLVPDFSRLTGFERLRNCVA